MTRPFYSVKKSADLAGKYAKHLHRSLYVLTRKMLNPASKRKLQGVI